MKGDTARMDISVSQNDILLLTAAPTRRRVHSGHIRGHFCAPKVFYISVSQGFVLLVTTLYTYSHVEYVRLVPNHKLGDMSLSQCNQRTLYTDPSGRPCSLLLLGIIVRLLSRGQFYNGSRASRNPSIERRKEVGYRRLCAWGSSYGTR